MKILFINDYATATGGAEIVIFTLQEELAKRGHEVKLFASNANMNGLPSQADAHCYGTVSPLRTYLQTANFSAYFQLKKLLAEWQPDIVHVSLFLTQLSPLILPLLKNYPALWHLHWYRGICPLGTKWLPTGRNCEVDYGPSCLAEGCLPAHQWLPLMWQMKQLEKHKRVFRRIVANSNFVKIAFERAGYGPLDVVWCATNDNKIAKLVEFSATPLIVFAGRLVKEKGVDLLLRAFAQVRQSVPEAVLKIAGEGGERKRLETLAANLGLAAQVKFLGHLSSEKLEIEFGDAWAQVVPSLYHEPFGLAVSEGMRRGTPVIATKVGGISELISHGENGLLVAPDERELAAAILQLMQNESLRNSLRRQAFAFSQKKFSAERFADEFLQIYQEMLR